MQFGQILRDLNVLDAWFSEHTSQEYKDQPLAGDCAQVIHMMEEAGEAAREFIKWTGQNSRKTQTETAGRFLQETADTVLTGILTLLHFTKDEAETGKILIERLRLYNARMVTSGKPVPALFIPDDLWMWDEQQQYDDWLNDLMANAPTCWDGDEAMESLVTRYVHHLEETMSQHMSWCDEANPLGHD